MRFGLMHDRDQAVAGLRNDGYSLRSIAKIQGMSLAGVQRALQRAKKPPIHLDDDDDSLLDPLRLDDDSPPLGSVRFVGADELDQVELFADERGKRFNLLELYRHARIDGGVLFGQACKQVEAAGRGPRQKSGPSESW
jgi:hypothetical protein